MVAAGPAHTLAHRSGAVGYVTPGVSVQIVNQAGDILPPGKEGILRIARDYAVDGYLDDPAESARAFRNGWFYPGDIASVSSDKLLVISGREKDILNLGGAKVNPERIEEVLTAFAGVVDAAVFGAANRLGIEEPWAAIVRAGDIDEEQLRAHCARELVSAQIPVSFVSVESLPRNEMGKIDRRRLAEVAKPN
jgi:acyl-CoA synthetase (AMP-forming)/AMP-acid ligase II